MMPSEAMRLKTGDALIVLDVQRDFCAGGALEIADADKIVSVVNGLIEEAVAARVPVFASRDWHPPGHASFHESGGPWPAHCVQGSAGAEFHPELRLPESAIIIAKGAAPERDQLSAFNATGLADRLRDLDVRRLLIVGLALDVCGATPRSTPLRKDLRRMSAYPARAPLRHKAEKTPSK